MIARPDASEYHEYFERYISLVPDGDIIDLLGAGLAETTTLLRAVPADKADHRYAPGKWSIREVVAHLSDCERTFGFRAFWFARSGEGALPSLDHLVFSAQAGADRRSLASLVDELEAVRIANLAFFQTLDDATSRRTGVAGGHPVSVRALAYIAAGHEIHHRRQLQEIYLGDAA